MRADGAEICALCGPLRAQGLPQRRGRTQTARKRCAGDVRERRHLVDDAARQWHRRCRGSYEACPRSFIVFCAEIHSISPYGENSACKSTRSFSFFGFSHKLRTYSVRQGSGAAALASRAGGELTTAAGGGGPGIADADVAPMACIRTVVFTQVGLSDDGKGDGRHS